MHMSAAFHRHVEAGYQIKGVNKMFAKANKSCQDTAEGLDYEHQFTGIALDSQTHLRFRYNLENTWPTFTHLVCLIVCLLFCHYDMLD